MHLRRAAPRKGSSRPLSRRTVARRGSLGSTSAPSGRSLRKSSSRAKSGTGLEGEKTGVATRGRGGSGPGGGEVGRRARRAHGWSASAWRRRPCPTSAARWNLFCRRRVRPVIPARVSYDTPLDSRAASGKGIRAVSLNRQDSCREDTLALMFSVGSAPPLSDDVLQERTRGFVARLPVQRCLDTPSPGFPARLLWAFARGVPDRGRGRFVLPPCSSLRNPASSSPCVSRGVAAR